MDEHITNIFLFLSIDDKTQNVTHELNYMYSEHMNDAYDIIHKNLHLFRMACYLSSEYDVIVMCINKAAS